MSHRMQVLVGRHPALEGVDGVVALPQGFALVELGPALRAAWGGVVGRPLVPFEHLDHGALRFALTRSRAAPIAYLEANYFGVMGTQAAAAWHDGQPVVPGRRSPEEGLSQPPWGDPRGPINEALGAIGVDVGEARDAFDALELWRFSRGKSRADPRGLG